MLKAILFVTAIGLVSLSFVYLRAKPKKDKLGDFGQLLFTKHTDEFAKYYALFSSDKKAFLDEYKDLLEDHLSDEYEMTAIEAVNIFGYEKGYIEIIDWRGEEGNIIVERFCEKLVGKPIAWDEAAKIRNSVDGEEQHDGVFIINLFKAADKDLEKAGYKLVFIDMGTDSYSFSVATADAYKKIMGLNIPEAHGTNKLK